MELIPLIVLFVAFLWFSNRRRKSAAQQLETSVKVGAKAVMLGGITGVITEIRDTSVIVETFPGTKIEFLKAAVRNVETPSLDDVPTKETVAAKPAAVKKPVSTTAKKAPATKATTSKAKSSTTKSAK